MEAHKRTLPNGFRVVAVPMAGTSTVSAVVMVHAGSRYENRRINGIAHFLEHMGFKGARRYRDARAVAEAIEQFGGKTNAFTNRESISYYAKVPAGKYRVALDVLSDMLFHSRFDPQEIERERNVILQELHRIQDNPAELVGDEFELQVLGDHPLGRSIIGTEESIRSINRRNLCEYIRRHFVVEKMVLAVAGNVDPNEAFVSAADYFFEPRPSMTPHAEYRSYRMPSRAEPVRIVQRDIAQTHLMLGTHGVSQYDPRRYPAGVAATILGKGMSSRLFLEVRERRGLAYAVSCSSQLFSDAGTFFVYAGVENERTREAVHAIIGECVKLGTELVSEEELRKSKNMILGRLEMDLEDSYTQAVYAAAYELLYQNPSFFEEHRRNVEAVTAEDIRSFAREFFKPEAFHLTLVGPHNTLAEFEAILREEQTR